MVSRLVSAAIIAVYFLSSAQAEIYKTVDAQGHVMFSSQAPVGSDQKKVDKIELHEGYSNKIQITQTGSVSYCGSIALPVRDVGSTNFYGTVVNDEKMWRQESARIEKQLSQYQRYARPETTAYNNDNLTKLAEYQCASDWAQQQRSKAKEERLALNRKSDGLNAYLKELTDGQVSVCGEEPVYSSSDRLFDDKRRSWQRCTADYRVKMTDIQADLKKADQQLLDIQKIGAAQ